MTTMEGACTRPHAPAGLRDLVEARGGVSRPAAAEMSVDLPEASAGTRTSLLAASITSVSGWPVR